MYNVLALLVTAVVFPTRPTALSALIFWQCTPCGCGMHWAAVCLSSKHNVLLLLNYCGVCSREEGKLWHPTRLISLKIFWGFHILWPILTLSLKPVWIVNDTAPAHRFLSVSIKHMSIERDYNLPDNEACQSAHNEKHFFFSTFCSSISQPQSTKCSML